MKDGFPGGSLLAGLIVAAALAGIPLVGFITDGTDAESASWLEIVRAIVLVGLLAVVLIVVLPTGWNYLRQHAITAAAHAREHQPPDADDGSGRVFPSGPEPEQSARPSPQPAPAHPNDAPPVINRWWFALEGWQQASIIGALVGVLLALASHRAFDHDGFSATDLITLAWVWAATLWFSLTVWTRAYFARAHPALRSWTVNARVSPIGCLGLLGAFEMFPQAVWFLATLLFSAVAAPFRAATRRLRGRTD